MHTLNSAYNEVTFNENLAITKENLHTKYTNSPINTSALTKATYNEVKFLHIFFCYRQSWVYVLCIWQPYLFSLIYV